jgi:hypothetical protein
MVMPTQITTPTESELHIINKPDYRANLSMYAICLLLTLVFALLKKPEFLFWFLFIPMNMYVAFLLVIEPRERNCKINLREGKITLQKNGILNSSVDFSLQESRLSDLVSIQMLRRSTRGPDPFSIQLVFESSPPLVIANEGLGFKDCQDYSSKLQKFLGTHIPIVAVG